MARFRACDGASAAAAASFAEAVSLARERALACTEEETGLALAQYHLGTLADPRAEAERLARTPGRHERWLARLWHALGEPEQARAHALAA